MKKEPVAEYRWQDQADKEKKKMEKNCQDKKNKKRNWSDKEIKSSATISE